MAITQYSGVIYGDYNKYNRLRINYNISQDDATAISTITMDLYAERTRTYRQYNNTGSSYWNLTGKGNTYINFDWAEGSSEYYLGNSSTTVQHNAEGIGSVTLSGYWYTGRVNSNSIPESMSISQTIDLKTIPRASTVSGGSGNIGSDTTISISRKSTSFTHTLRYAFSDLNGTIATGVGTSHTWKIPTSFYAKIPNAKSGNGTIYCDTYNGGTLIGTKSVGFTATASESSSRPTVTATVVDTNEVTKALTGNANKLILGKSTAKITATPSAKNSSTIKTVTIDGVSTTDNTRTIANVSKSTFPIVVTDSRGYTNTSYSATPSGGTVSYVELTINATFYRPQPTTGEVELKYSGNYFNASFGSVANTLSITWKYKEKGAEDWITGGTITPTLNGNKIEEKTISLGTTYDYQKAYEFQITAVDKLTTYSNTSTVSVGTPVFYWGKNKFVVTKESHSEKKHWNHQGSSTKLLRGGEQQSGYMYACQIKINRTYANQYIELGVVQRNRRGTIYICFVGNDSKDPSIGSFWKSGSTVAYISKVATSTWDLYIQKTEWYDDIEVVELHKGAYMDSVTIEWKGWGRTELPSSYTTATSYMTKTLSSVSHTGFGTNSDFHPDIAFLSYWNGAYDSNNASNLTYCKKGGIRGNSCAQISWGRQTISCTAWEQRSFGTATSSMANGRFSISGNNIVVGAGVTRVRVSLHSVSFHPRFWRR